MLPAGLAQAGDTSAGFFFDHFKLIWEDGQRTEAAGPFYYSQATESNRVWAVPPFYSCNIDPKVEAHEDDFLYPVLTRGQYGHERRWQFCQVLNTSSGREPDDSQVRQFTLFPFYFQQRAGDTNLNYTAVFPIYGQLKHRLFKDEINFILFPVYVRTHKRDRVTDNYFYPLVDVHHGDGMTGWQFWPLVGREHKVVTTQTNGYGEVTVVPGHDYSFYLWPFDVRQDNGIGTVPEKFRASIPFYALRRSAPYDSTTIVWPLFNFIHNRAQKYHEWQAPWPLVVFGQGETKHLSRVWPVYSELSTPTQEVDSYAWPFYTYTRQHSDSLDQRRTRVLYYLYSRQSVKDPETGREKVRLDMWPFFTWHRDLNGRERLQVLAPLEPAVPDNHGIERNWSPLWSVWRAESNPRTGARNQSLLWNLYRHESAPAHEKTSCLFGLYQREQHTNEVAVRVFYLRVR